MGNCMLIKLKGSSTNENLPEFVNIVDKEWIKTTVDGQYLDLSYFTRLNRYNSFGIEIKFRGDESTNIERKIFLTSSSYIYASWGTDGNLTVGVAANGQINQPKLFPCSTGDEHVVRVDVRNETIAFDNETVSITKTGVSSSAPSFTYVGGSTGSTSKAGALSIAYIKVFDNSGTLKNHFQPKIINGVHCLKDTETGDMLLDATGGDLLAYNDEE